jgi:hypothetical protein
VIGDHMPVMSLDAAPTDARDRLCRLPMIPSAGIVRSRPRHFRFCETPVAEIAVIALIGESLEKSASAGLGRSTAANRANRRNWSFVSGSCASIACMPIESPIAKLAQLSEFAFASNRESGALNPASVCQRGLGRKEG